MAIVIPLLPFEKYIIAHAIFCVIGFLGLLPLGALLARYSRTSTPRWFTAHWIVQFAIGTLRSFFICLLQARGLRDPCPHSFRDIELNLRPCRQRAL